ncbi:uncharacterized protein LOC125035007 [Penaeus chinensis]|uniref:uncharacterized protein LOC125035007 n=1 Tax=Penaeus chinensis TaxID=139456 RepID=UPI001FB59D92|nr:uncharacterized protein LOC125035007 [Penaeus chinensis]
MDLTKEIYTNLSTLREALTYPLLTGLKRSKQPFLDVLNDILGTTGVGGYEVGCSHHNIKIFIGVSSCNNLHDWYQPPLPYSLVSRSKQDQEILYSLGSSLPNTHEQTFSPLLIHRHQGNKIAKKIFYHNKLYLQPSQFYGKVQELCVLANRPCTFPSTSNLSHSEAAEALDDHIASLSQQLPALDTTCLPSYLPPSHLPLVSVSFRCSRSREKFASREPPMQGTVFVIAIEKTPSPTSFGELRPIAIIPLPSLLCESFIADWAYQDLAASVDTRQFSNMCSSSTTHCLVSFLDFVLAHLHKRKSSSNSTFIDFKKSFYLVDHTTLISKAAASMGIRKCLIPWLADFLSNKQQDMRMQGQVFSLLPLTCGIAQGTRMGPLCFLAMSNDALLDIEYRWKYEDDSTIAAAIGFTYWVAFGVPLPELHNIYRLFILPKMIYASPTWAPSLTATQLLQLDRVQKRAAKIIY